MATVVTNRCFDLLHVGHLNLLMYCKELAGEGGELIVLIDDDSKIRADKGEHRSIFTTHERMRTLSDIPFGDKKLVDRCMHFYNDEHLADLIKSIRPNFLVKGSDWKGKKVVGEQYANQVIFYDRIDGYSSSSIIERVRKPDRNWRNK